MRSSRASCSHSTLVYQSGPSEHVGASCPDARTVNSDKRRAFACMFPRKRVSKVRTKKDGCVPEVSTKMLAPGKDHTTLPKSATLGPDDYI